MDAKHGITLVRMDYPPRRYRTEDWRFMVQGRGDSHHTRWTVEDRRQGDGVSRKTLADIRRWIAERLRGETHADLHRV